MALFEYIAVSLDKGVSSRSMEAIPIDISQSELVNTSRNYYIKFSWPLLVVGLFVLYILLALLPYMGRIYVSAETREAFSMQNFYNNSDEQNPERVMLLEDPQDAFFHRINLISNAQEQILLSSFAIQNGTTSDIMIGALLSAADRGVDITIMNNAVGGLMPQRYLNILSAHDNIDVYLFNRFEFFRPQYINSALHDKYIVVDDILLILGGRNIGDKYFAPDGFDGRFSFDREILVFNTDPNFNGSIAQVIDYFNSKIYSQCTSLFDIERRNTNWKAQRNYYINLYLEFRESLVICTFDYYANTIKVNRITLITNSIDSTKNDSVVAYNLMRITQNSNTVIAQSPYVSFTDRSLNILVETVRDRNVILLTNSLASTPNIPAFSSYYVNRQIILNMGVTIYEYQSTQSSIHAKTYLFDGRLTAIGSFNLNERSIRSDTESMLIIDSEKFHDIVLEAINSQMAQSLRVNAENNRYYLDSDVAQANVSLGKRILYNVAGRLLRMFRFMF